MAIYDVQHAQNFNEEIAAFILGKYMRDKVLAYHLNNRS